MGIVIGPILGANEMDEAKDTAAKMITFSVVMGVFIGVMLFLTAPLFPRIYNTEDSVRALAVSIIRIGALFVPAYAFENAAYFTLRAGGKTIITFLFDSAFMCVLVVPVAYVLSRFTAMNILLLYACVNMLDFIKCGIGFTLVKKGVWVHNIVDEINV